MSKNLGTIEKLMDGYNPHRQRMEETRGLVKKWEPTGLLEGLDTEHKSHGMAVLLENQARQLIDESSHTGTSANSEEWSGKEPELEQELNAWWDNKLENEFSIKSKLEIEFETHFSPFFMPTILGAESGSKKRDAGMKVCGDEKQLVFKGLESVRSDWTELAKQFQRELFTLVFNNENCENFIQLTINQLRNGKLDELLVYKKRIKRKLKDYIKTTPPHIKAARIANSQANKQIYSKGSNIEYVITTNGPRVKTQFLMQMDYQHYIDKQLLPIAEAILLNYSPNSLNYFSQQMSLL